MLICHLSILKGESKALGIRFIPLCCSCMQPNSVSICYLLLINLLNFYSEVITSAEFHPFQCNLLAYSSSRGFIHLVDMRRSALCDHSARMWVSAHFCFISMVHVSRVLILCVTSHLYFLLYQNEWEDDLILVIWSLILQITGWRIPWVQIIFYRDHRIHLWYKIFKWWAAYLKSWLHESKGLITKLSMTFSI